MVVKSEDPTADVNQDIDLLTIGGYDATITGMRELTQCMVYLLLDIQLHRRDAIDFHTVAELGFNADCAGFASDQILEVLKGFSPLSASQDTEHPQQPDFDLSPGRLESLSDDEIADSIKSMSQQWDAIDHAIYQLSMALNPTAEQLSRLYIELARYRNIESAFGLALNQQLTLPTKNSNKAVDYFAVGETLAGLLASVLPVRCLPFVEQISLPVNPTPDLIIAGFLASRMFTNDEFCFLFQSSDFDASASHTSRHCVLSAGVPFHAPPQLCFDHRAVEGADSTLVLLRDHLKAHAAPAPAVEFATSLTELSNRLSAANEEKHLSAMFNLLWMNAETDSMAMSAAHLYLQSRFPPPLGLLLQKREGDCTDNLIQ